MRSSRALLLATFLIPLASCGQGERGAPAVARPREGGAEIDPPPGGFRPVAGQTLYVPAYSSIFTSDDPRSFDLAVTLSIRNADRRRPIVVTSVRYFDHDGRLVHDYLRRPLRVGPMAAVELFVGERDTRGGVSASFLVEWLSEEEVAPPVVESVMVGTASTQGVSFTSPGRVLTDRSESASPPTEGRQGRPGRSGGTGGLPTRADFYIRALVGKPPAPPDVNPAGARPLSSAGRGR